MGGQWCLMSQNVHLGSLTKDFCCILNTIRQSGRVIRLYRKAILPKVTHGASDEVRVMSILKPKTRQVTLIPERSYILSAPVSAPPSPTVKKK